MNIINYDEVNPNEGNMIRLTEMLLSKALQLHASDIHIEPLATYTRIRIRLDGILVELCRLPIAKHNSLISRIKLISEMDIAERRLPQDGRLSISYQNRNIDIRVASLPTVEGEKLVMRILDNNLNLYRTDQLGFDKASILKYQQLIKAPNGIILVTGPTGSGKSTTLYATLNEINDQDKNIVTLEDPIECNISGINQVAVNNKTGLNFTTCLRAFLRQDPDIIMIGEIRDKETAQIAIHAALTGHLVFSTLHTNSAIGTINRLLNMGVEPFLLLSALRGILSQRLVRKICPHCKEQYTPTLLELHCLGCSPKDNISLYRGKGCSHCQGTGYQGRVAVHELITIDDQLINMVLNNEFEKNILDYLCKNDFKTLQADGKKKVLQGITTLDELLRTAIL